jgi:hypothetical protein
MGKEDGIKDSERHTREKNRVKEVFSDVEQNSSF